MENDGERCDDEKNGGDGGQEKGEEGGDEDGSAFPCVKREKESERGTSGESQFGLGEKDEGVEKAREEEADGEAGEGGGIREAAESGIQREDGEKSEEESTGDFMGVRGEKIVVAQARVPGEGEEEDEGGDGESCGKGGSNAAEEGA